MSQVSEKKTFDEIIKILKHIDNLLDTKKVKEQDRSFQTEIITLMEEIEMDDLEEMNGSSDRHTVDLHLAIIAHTLAQNNLVHVIEYLVNRKDISNLYVSKAFIWACKRVGRWDVKDVIFAILNSGKVSERSLETGIQELGDKTDIIRDVLKKAKEIKKKPDHEDEVKRSPRVIDITKSITFYDPITMEEKKINIQDYIRQDINNIVIGYGNNQFFLTTRQIIDAQLEDALVYPCLKINEVRTALSNKPLYNLRRIGFTYNNPCDMKYYIDNPRTQLFAVVDEQVRYPSFVSHYNFHNQRNPNHVSAFHCQSGLDSNVSFIEAAVQYRGIMEEVHESLVDLSRDELQLPGFQGRLIKTLKKISNVVKEDTRYIEGEPETGLLSKLAHFGMVDVIKYLVNRPDVNSKYIDDGFWWACRSTEKDAVLAIFNSGKLSAKGLRKGMRELKTERATDIISEISKLFASTVMNRVSKKRKSASKKRSGGKTYRKKRFIKHRK